MVELGHLLPSSVPAPKPATEGELLDFLFDTEEGHHKDKTAQTERKIKDEPDTKVHKAA